MSQPRGARRFARFLAVLAGIGAVLHPIAVTAIWAAWIYGAFNASASRSMFYAVMSQELPFDPSLATPGALVAGWLIALVGVVPSVIALVSLRRSFLESAENRPFSHRSVSAFRRFAWASVAAVVVGALTATAIQPAVTGLSPDMQGELTISLSSQSIEKLFTALMLLALAHIFVEGRRMSEDVEGLL
jgi:hypothetical protein